MSAETQNPSELQPVAPSDAAQPVVRGGDDGGGPDARKLFARIFSLLLYPLIALVVASFTDTGWHFIKEHRVLIAVAFASLLVVAAMPTTRRLIAHVAPQNRVGLTLLLAVVILVSLVFLMFLEEPKIQAAILRVVFLLVVCLLPAVMFYLFIATKKYGLFNEFVMNLNRLGLLDPARVPEELVCSGLKGESEEERKNRIRTYIQRFEAVYGSIPTDLGGLMLEPTDLSKSNIDPLLSKTDALGFANLFTFDTIIPVLLATVLIALGWLITLPPWEGKIGRQSNQVQIEVAGTKPSGAAAKTAAPASPGDNAQAQTDQAASGTSTAEEQGQQSEDEEGRESWASVLTPDTTPVRFAFVGAYFFSLQLLFRRYVRRDLRASAYVAASLRIILAVIGIWVVSEARGLIDWQHAGTDSAAGDKVDDSLIVLGFVIGVFPRVAWQIIQSVAGRIASVVVPSLKTQLPISDLDGLTVWHEARFEEEDIENIPNMATADLVDLMINTRFPPDRLIDWVDQSILYTHLGPNHENDASDPRAILRAHGIRTATSLIEAYNRSVKYGDTDKFEEILAGDVRKPIRSLVDAVGTNPNLKLIQTWRGLQPLGYPKAAA